MVADSPYAHRDLALPLGIGAAAGCVSVLVVVAILTFLLHVPQTPLQGQIQLALFGSLFGLLYASSQGQAPWRGLIAVGVFYGLIVWVISGPLLGRLAPTILPAVARTGWWFVGCIGFGLSLSVVTGLYQLVHPQHSTSIPRD